MVPNGIAEAGEFGCDLLVACQRLADCVKGRECCTDVAKRIASEDAPLLGTGEVGFEFTADSADPGCILEVEKLPRFAC